jgi:hypothetical protein
VKGLISNEAESAHSILAVVIDMTPRHRTVIEVAISGTLIAESHMV